MGGGSLYPSANTVHELIAAARASESIGNFVEAIRRYREAAELLLMLAKNISISEDERFALEVQSSELTVKANSLENLNQSPSLTPKIQFAEPVRQIGRSASTPASAPPYEHASGSGTSEQVGAAAVGAVSGLAVGSMIGMPLFGMMAGGVAGGITAQMENEYGAKARKFGKHGATAIDSAKGLDRKYNISGNTKVAVESAVYKAKELNEKHDITGNVKRTAEGAYARACELNEKHDVTGKAKKAASSTAKAASDFDKKYKVRDKIGAAVISGFQSVKKAVHGHNSNQNQNE